ncbi:M20 family metallo-hydrolase [Paenibacillus agricola]|uniref:M20 family metallo-hydrolase n=1 Tax=Paenibacillus agricola TaxID=2716264 RepID=A0ABX0JA07_9BACL|nr:M20 family metallo-hydrolase [Paenibacillus agricola]NHN31014.1 M20 family metallo-hydrolase [Paenibacillus agricola]
MSKPYNEIVSNTDALILRFAREADDMLNWLAQYGAAPEGGVTRLLYTPEWQQAQQALAERMVSVGLTPYLDDAGNLFGRLQGMQEGVIVTGSHLDTVAHGGRFDGAYGIVAGVLALAYLKEKYGSPQRSIDIVSFAEEEGSRFPLTFWGSGTMTGRYSTVEPPLIYDAEGITLQAAMEAAGFGQGNDYRSGEGGQGGALAPAAGNGIQPIKAGDDRPQAYAASDWKAFIELHIEQGSVLEREDRQIGIVQGIVGQHRYTLEVKGEANHAGTTPMSYRKDALVGASEMVLAIREAAIAYGEPMVATVGRLEASPGASNVVAGSAVFTLDVRHPQIVVLDEFCESLLVKLQLIAEQAGLSLTVNPWMKAPPAMMNQELTDLARQVCGSRGFSSRDMYSGAGHDAQVLAPICPSTMVFVPSRAGISHSPDEYTKPEELATGIIVLIDILYALAYKEDTL